MKVLRNRQPPGCSIEQLAFFDASFRHKKKMLFDDVVMSVIAGYCSCKSVPSLIAMIGHRENEDYMCILGEIFAEYHYFRANKEVILLSPVYSYIYARDEVSGRWKKAEGIILTSAEYSYKYASIIRKSRWEEAENVIMTSPKYSYRYARDVIKAPWREAEEIISTSIDWSYAYARYVTKC